MSDRERERKRIMLEVTLYMRQKKWKLHSIESPKCLLGDQSASPDVSSNDINRFNFFLKQQTRRLLCFEINCPTERGEKKQTNKQKQGGLKCCVHSVKSKTWDATVNEEILIYTQNVCN